MTDPDLLAAGVGVTFLFFAGVYIVARESFRRSMEDEDDGEDEDEK